MTIHPHTYPMIHVTLWPEMFIWKQDVHFSLYQRSWRMIKIDQHDGAAAALPSFNRCIINYLLQGALLYFFQGDLLLASISSTFLLLWWSAAGTVLLCFLFFLIVDPSVPQLLSFPLLNRETISTTFDSFGFETRSHLTSIPSISNLGRMAKVLLEDAAAW